MIFERVLEEFIKLCPDNVNELKAAIEKVRWEFGGASVYIKIPAPVEKEGGRFQTRLVSQRTQRNRP